ncbi:MAG: hypothetical protein F6K17_21895 [Okeania sp. SIO3C4]|nr:hypothetical protein [Okeania sp. SIO3C4]
MPKYSPESEKIKASVLKVRGKTLIYEDTVYQINNITSIRCIELKTTKKRTRIFSILLFIGAASLVSIGIILLQSPNKNLQIFCLLLIVVGILLLYYYRLNRTSKQYGLVIEGNSGYKNIIVSSNKLWIQRVIVELWDVMNSGPEKLKSLTFNFNNYSIESSVLGTNSEKLKPLTFNFNDYSINGSNIVETNINSPILSNNNVKGDLDVDSIMPGIPDFGYDLYLLAIAKLLNNKYLRLFSFYFHSLIQQR